MRFPLSWLREWLTIEADEADLLHRLTMAGLEVEEVEAQGVGLNQLVVALIEQCEPHPDADRLRVCQVNAGGDERLQIVCGAPNARAGLRVPLIGVGRSLPDGTQIRRAKLRGVESAGMLCSARELGLSEEHDGLLELPADAVPGTPLDQLLGYPDTVIELSITPNRGDCLSLAGVARDLGALYGAPVEGPSVDPVPATLERQIEIRLQAGPACPRYCGRFIEGLDATLASPDWMQRRLRQCGLRPINALVDVTNYVMLELGQPLHAFSADRLSGAIDVRWAQAGERLQLLDEREIELVPDMLLIADQQGPVALAGVMGGNGSKVVQSTRAIFLESAHFAPAAISGRARRLGMHTDAAHRFERGVDPELPRRALERATALLLAIGGGQAGPVIEAVHAAELPARAPIGLRHDRLQRVLGMSIDRSRVGTILRALGLQVEDTDAGWRAIPPGPRFDLEIEEDLIEEVIRVHGYDALPTRLPRGEISLRSPSEFWVSDGELARNLVSRGYREAVCMAFGRADLYDSWSMPPSALLANPLSADLGAMRPSLLPGLVQALLENQRRQLDRVRLFEIGRAFPQREQESQRLALVSCGPAQPEQWGLPTRGGDFHDLKADVEGLLTQLGQAAVRWTRSEQAFLHPGRSADLWHNDVCVGWVGHLHPALMRKLDAAGEVIVGELALDALRPRSAPAPAALSRYPSVRRDLAMIVANVVDFEQVRAAVATLAFTSLRELRLFDVYQGQGVPEGSKSLAIGLIFQEDSRTLAEGEVDAWVDAIRQRLTASVGATWRG